MVRLVGVLVSAAWLLVSASCLDAGDVRPNVVWIVADDLGPELGCYGYPDVRTSNLDRLAAEGRRYTRAYSTAPVCSASRTAMQTGLYQTTVGGHHHNTRNKPVLPESVPTVVGLMRDAGYYSTNGRALPMASNKLAKSHFNFVYDARTYFDGNDWTKRAEGQPFFAQIQIKEPHRGFVQNDRERPETPIPPYYPDHPVTRADWDQYLASIEVLDEKVGVVLDQLDAEGVSENTLVMFVGDHGRPHVRGKQWLYEGGLHTPLIVRWPGKVEAGSVTDNFASLLDLMPTTLAAAGVDSPELPGLDLVDPEWSGHERVFAARDRCGDAPDRIRSLRTDRFKYIRNFRPDVPYMQHSGYKKLSYPVVTVMSALHERGEWSSPFMADVRPPEELYDLENDPHEMTNLAGDPAYGERLKEMREALEAWIDETNDQGAIDERLSVDLDAVLAEKWGWYERTMRRRGLDPELSNEAYVDWWENELGVAK